MPLQIVSGLVNFVPEEQMQGRKVLVLANLKPLKLRGIQSSGMVSPPPPPPHPKKTNFCFFCRSLLMAIPDSLLSC